MYGNSHLLNTYTPVWGNGNGHPKSAPGHMGQEQGYPRASVIQRENIRLDEHRIRLEKEIEELLQRKQQLEASFPEPECEKKLGFWGGSQIVDSTETSFCINFYPQFKGKLCGTYSIALHKLGQCWNLSHHNLPYSIQDINLRVTRAQLNTLDKLSSFIRCLQQEINLFVWRSAQFAEAKSLTTSSFAVHPSVSTTKVLLTFRVDDNIGSTLSKAFVNLSYQSHKYLPEEPLFQFVGGDQEARETFKEQLTTLECMPLKEAILTAFPASEMEPVTQESQEEKVASNSPNLELTSPAAPAAAAERKQRLSSTASKEKSSAEESDEPTSSGSELSTVPAPLPSTQSRGRGRGRGRGSRGTATRGGAQRARRGGKKN